MEIKEINWDDLSKRFLDYFKNKIEKEIKEGIYNTEIEGLIVDELIKECDDGR